MVALEWVTVVCCGRVDANCCVMGEVEGWKATLRGCGRRLEDIAAWKTAVGGWVGGMGAVDGGQVWPLSGK